jgi:uncharacterized protein (TIGR00645 family)
MIDKHIEKFIFQSRWLLAPIYLGLVFALVLLLITFARELFHYLSQSFTLEPDQVILGILSLIDLSLAGNLVLVVIFSGYENFVSKMDIDDHPDNPEWKTGVDFAALKLKLVASIVAISGIHLLKIFMDIEHYSQEHIQLMIIIHVVFVISGVLLALMDRIASDTKNIKKKKVA